MTTLALSAAAWAIVAAACLLVGSSGSVAVADLGRLFADDPVMAYRREMVGLASLVGAALASAGVAYQATLRNPLADPYLLGVSSGAALAAYLWQLPAGRFDVGPVASLLGQQAFAFGGALLAVLVVFAVAGWRGRRGGFSVAADPTTVVLVGVIVNAVCGSAFLLVNALVRDRPGGGGAIAFLVGDLQTNLTATPVLAAAATVTVGWVGLLWLAGRLNVAGLESGEASSLGVRVDLLRWSALAVASLMTAAAVAVSGPIGFVGLVCPHLARLLVGSDVRRLLPVATAIGAGLLAVAHATCRGLAGSGGVGTILPVGVLTGLMGGPFFLLLLVRRR